MMKVGSIFSISYSVEENFLNSVSYADSWGFSEPLENYLIDFPIDFFHNHSNLLNLEMN